MDEPHEAELQGQMVEVEVEFRSWVRVEVPAISGLLIQEPQEWPSMAVHCVVSAVEHRDSWPRILEPGNGDQECQVIGVYAVAADDE